MKIKHSLFIACFVLLPVFGLFSQDGEEHDNDVLAQGAGAQHSERTERANSTPSDQASTSSHSNVAVGCMGVLYDRLRTSGDNPCAKQDPYPLYAQCPGASYLEGANK